MPLRIRLHRPLFRSAALLAAGIAVLGLATVATPASATASARLTGTVSGAQLDPDLGLAAALVTVYPSGDPETPVAMELVTGAGDYEIVLPAGSYRVSARTEARATEWWPEAAGAAASTPVVLAAGGSADLDFSLDVPAASFTLDPDDGVAVYGLGEAGTPLTVDPGALSPQPDAFTYQWLRGSVVLPGETGPTITAGTPPQTLLVAVTPHRAGFSEWPLPGTYPLTEPVEGLVPLLAAMDADPETHVSGKWRSELAVNAVVPAGIAVGTRPIRGFPTEGNSYAVLSTGVAAEALEPGAAAVELSTDIGSAPGDDIFYPTDETRVRLTVAPPPGLECLAMDLLYGSEDGSDYATVESPVADEAEDGAPPDNFARTASGGVLGRGTDLPLTPEPDWRVDGWTQPVTARVPLSGESVAGPGYSDVIVSVLDIGDYFLDSVVLVDNLRFEPAAGCPSNGIVTPIEDPAPVIEGTVPLVDGSARVGSRLTVEAGEWSPSGVSLSYQWLRNGQAIPGATGDAYLVRARDLLSRLSVTVTGSLEGAEPVALVSDPTGRVGLPR